tara:strand:+ start:297 stop:1241 length:945 start_codon:yes stop_codon:yes gene_type:complete
MCSNVAIGIEALDIDTTQCLNYLTDDSFSRNYAFVDISNTHEACPNDDEHEHSTAIYETMSTVFAFCDNLNVIMEILLFESRKELNDLYDKHDNIEIAKRMQTLERTVQNIIQVDIAIRILNKMEAQIECEMNFSDLLYDLKYVCISSFNELRMLLSVVICAFSDDFELHVQEMSNELNLRFNSSSVDFANSLWCKTDDIMLFEKEENEQKMSLHIGFMDTNTYNSSTYNRLREMNHEIWFTTNRTYLNAFSTFTLEYIFKVRFGFAYVLHMPRSIILRCLTNTATKFDTRVIQKLKQRTSKDCIFPELPMIIP